MNFCIAFTGEHTGKVDVVVLLGEVYFVLSGTEEALVSQHRDVCDEAPVILILRVQFDEHQVADDDVLRLFLEGE